MADDYLAADMVEHVRKGQEPLQLLAVVERELEFAE